MAVFEYKALDENGRKTNGIIDASSVEEARDRLREKALFPVDVTVTNQNTTNRYFFSFKRISSEDISLFSHQLASLLKWH